MGAILANAHAPAGSHCVDDASREVPFFIFTSLLDFFFFTRVCFFFRF